MKMLADYPAFAVFELQGDINLTNDKGYVRTAPVKFYLKGFPGDKDEYLRSFTIGCDGDKPENVWAYGNGAMLTSHKVDKEIAFGLELGQRISIEGVSYIVKPDHNHNIKFERA